MEAQAAGGKPAGHSPVAAQVEVVLQDVQLHVELRRETGRHPARSAQRWQLVTWGQSLCTNSVNMSHEWQAKPARTPANAHDINSRRPLSANSLVLPQQQEILVSPCGTQPTWLKSTARWPRRCSLPSSRSSTSILPHASTISSPVEKVDARQEDHRNYGRRQPVEEVSTQRSDKLLKSTTSA